MMVDNAQIEQIVRSIVETISKDNSSVRVGVSARHIHLTAEHVSALFGVGYELTKKAELMGGQFAANETVTIVSAKMRTIENVRVLGPVRRSSQLEISATDAVKLGIAAPVRESGDVASSAPMTVIGPKGSVYLREGCIVAARHIHASPDDAARLGIADGDRVSVTVSGERGMVLNNVKIRVDESFTTEMHIDTDEANACGLKTGDYATIRRVNL